jgi:trk system potassium uptake protein
VTARTTRDDGPVGLPGRRPGDRRVRIEHVKPLPFEIRPPKRVRPPRSPAAVLVGGFAALIAIGTVLLALPIASATGIATPLGDAFFTATSAVCVTGLVVVDTATHWSPFGQAVILALIQVGGFGFMTGSTLLLLLLIGRRTGLRDRLIVQASTGALDMGSVSTLARRVGLFTVVVEGVGMLVLAVAFLRRGVDPGTSLWWGLFHSVSSFNNAGFDLFGEFRSLTGFADDAVVLGTIGVVFVLGGLGFAIVGDVVGKRRWSRLALETKVVLATTLALLVTGSVAVGLLEWSNPETLGALAPQDRVTNAVFQSATARTVGFNSVAIGGMLEPSLIVLIGLMFVGGASGSTAGGIKVNTFSVLLIAIVASVRGAPSPVAFGRRLPHEVVYRALSVALLSIAVVFIVAFGLELASDARFIDLAFEAVSALGTVGLTTGITPGLSDAALLLLAAAMFVGRLGPLTLVLALSAGRRQAPYRPAVESMRIG